MDGQGKMEMYSAPPPKDLSAVRPQVSVVIPTYNSRELVGRAIRSVLAQTRPPKEIIVVDDGSTDGTGEIVQQEFGRRIAYHYQENQGPAAARNTGIRMSSGEWIALLDADDFWAPEKLELQEAEAFADPEVAMVACEATSYSPDGKEGRRRHLPRPLTKEAACRGLKQTNVFPMGVMVRRDVFDRVGTFDERLFCGEDREMWARVSARFKVAGIHRPLVNVTLHPGSVSSNPDLIVRDGLLVNRRIIEMLGDHSFLGFWKDCITLRRVDSRTLRSAAYAYEEREEACRAAWTMIKSLGRWPFSPPGAYRFTLRLCGRLLLNRSKRVTRSDQRTNSMSHTKIRNGDSRI